MSGESFDRIHSAHNFFPPRPQVFGNPTKDGLHALAKRVKWHHAILVDDRRDGRLDSPVKGFGVPHDPGKPPHDFLAFRSERLQRLITPFASGSGSRDERVDRRVYCLNLARVCGVNLFGCLRQFGVRVVLDLPRTFVEFILSEVITVDLRSTMRRSSPS